MKLRNKLILFYIPFLLIPMIALDSYLTVIIRNSTIEQSIRIYQQSTEQLQSNILNKLEEYYSMAYDIATDSNIKQYLNMSNSSEKDIDLYNFYNDRISGLILRANYRDPNAQIHIYTSNRDLKFAGIFIRDEEQLNQKINLVKGHLGTVCWTGIEQENIFKNQKMTNVKYLECLMPILVYEKSANVIGVVEIHIDVSSLEQFLSNLNDKEQDIIFLTNNKNQPIISNTNVDSTLLNISQGILGEKDDSIFYNGKEYLLINYPIESKNLNIYGWKLTSLIPLDMVYQNTENIQRANIIACILCILIAIPLLILFSGTITKRLEYLVEKMDHIGRGYHNVSVNVAGNDEISRLGRKFNEMIQKLELMTKEKISAELKEKELENARNEARIFALERQINPHYLFNTLESIRMSLVLKGDIKTADLIQIFAKSFRAIIDTNEQFITLHDEVQFIRDYFVIQNFCYDGKIHLHEDISPKLFHYRIPKFLLQPLVENAIYHGLELKSWDGNIYLSIKQKNGFLVIRVQDDGVGMKKEDLLALQESLLSESFQDKHHALKNIAERLDLIYEKCAQLTIQSRPNYGTSVCIRLPMEKLEVELDVQCNNRGG